MTRRPKPPPERRRPSPSPDLGRTLTAERVWNEADYLLLSGRTRRRLELAAGRLEALPVPTDEHETIAFAIARRFAEVLEPAGGKVLPAGVRIRTRPGRFRLPDVSALLDAADARRGNDYWRGADVVVEVVSPDDPRRDRIVKRREYAAAGIAEYWIVDPLARRVIVIGLEGDDYAEHGAFGPGDVAASRLVPSLTIDESALFDAR